MFRKGLHRHQTLRLMGDEARRGETDRRNSPHSLQKTTIYKFTMYDVFSYLCLFLRLDTRGGGAMCGWAAEAAPTPQCTLPRSAAGQWHRHGSRLPRAPDPHISARSFSPFAAPNGCVRPRKARFCRAARTIWRYVGGGSIPVASMSIFGGGGRSGVAIGMRTPCAISRPSEPPIRFRHRGTEIGKRSIVSLIRAF